MTERQSPIIDRASRTRRRRAAFVDVAGPDATQAYIEEQQEGFRRAAALRRRLGSKGLYGLMGPKLAGARPSAE